MKNSVLKFLTNLGVKKIYCYMLHNEDFLNFWNTGLKEIMTGLKEDNFIETIGISVYSPQKALEAIKATEIDHIQIPSNLLDRRFENADVFQMAKKYSKKLYIRSIFLQGLILLQKNRIPASMKFVENILLQLDTLSSQYNLNRQQLAIGYAKEAYPETNIILGSETSLQVSENVKFWNDDYSFLDVKNIRKHFNSIEERVLNPSKWKH